jgi:hypothetical protein
MLPPRINLFSNKKSFLFPIEASLCFVFQPLHGYTHRMSKRCLSLMGKVPRDFQVDGLTQRAFQQSLLVAAQALGFQP